MRRSLPLPIVLLAALLLAACQAPPPARPPPTTGSTPDLPADFPLAAYAGATPGTLWQPGPGSRIDVLVRRAGPMAALGHNHVLSSPAIRGRVRWDGRRGRADLVLRAADLAVDPPAARARHGGDFAGTVPDDAVAGTRRNLLGPDVLDAGDHPWLRARIEALRTQGDRVTGTLVLTVRGQQHRRTLALPAAQVAARRVHLRLALDHADLGLTPFSVLGGALRVADGLLIDCVLALEPVESAAP